VGVTSFVFTVVGGIIAVEGLVLPPDAKPEIRSVVHPEEQETRDTLNQTHSDLTKRLDELNSKLTSLQEMPRLPQIPLPPTVVAPQTPATTQEALAAPASPAPLPCGPLSANKRAILFYVSATVNGSSGISSDAVEEFIASYLPQPNFYSVTRPECAAFRINAYIDVNDDSNLNRVSASTHLEYASTKSRTSVNASAAFYGTLDVTQFKWSNECVVANSIYRTMQDDRLASFLTSDLKADLTVLAAVEKPSSQCGAGQQAYQQP
jgi:hypothetical protein